MTKYPSQMQEKFNLRFPDGMREQITEVAKASGRSMNSEIIARLEQSLAETESFGELISAKKAHMIAKSSRDRLPTNIIKSASEQILTAANIGKLEEYINLDKFHLEELDSEFYEQITKIVTTKLASMGYEASFEDSGTLYVRFSFTDEREE